MEDLEVESLLWSYLSFVSIPLPMCMPFALSPDQSVMYFDILLLQVLSVDRQHEHHLGACRNAGVRPHPKPTESESEF